MSKPEIQRYKYGYKDDGWGQRFLALIEDAEGAVVRFSDHEAAMAELEDDRAQCWEQFKAQGRAFSEKQSEDRAERNELLGLLRDILRTNPTVYCDSFHHSPKDQHSDHEECPVMSRYENAREAARTFMERHKC